MRDIYVVTHTESQHHIDDLVGGWYDSSLTERGRQQAFAVADRLADLTDTTPRIVSSDLARARETAEPIAARFDTDFTSMPDLREMSQGSGEGKPQAWFDERFTAAPEDNRLDHRSYEDGETKREMMTRIYRAMDEILEDDAPVQMIVTHGFALTFVIAAWVKMPLETAGYINVHATSGGISHLHEDDFFRNRQIRSLNDTRHLDGI